MRTIITASALEMPARRGMLWCMGNRFSRAQKDCQIEGKGILLSCDQPLQ
jgi:hypothetical protein